MSVSEKLQRGTLEWIPKGAQNLPPLAAPSTHQSFVPMVSALPQPHPSCHSFYFSLAQNFQKVSQRAENMLPLTHQDFARMALHRAAVASCLGAASVAVRTASGRRRRAFHRALAAVVDRRPSVNSLRRQRQRLMVHHRAAPTMQARRRQRPMPARCLHSLAEGSKHGEKYDQSFYYNCQWKRNEKHVHAALVLLNASRQVSFLFAAKGIIMSSQFHMMTRW